MSLGAHGQSFKFHQRHEGMYRNMPLRDPGHMVHYLNKKTIRSQSETESSWAFFLLFWKGNTRRNQSENASGSSWTCSCLIKKQMGDQSENTSESPWTCSYHVKKKIKGINQNMPLGVPGANLFVSSKLTKKESNKNVSWELLDMFLNIWIRKQKGIIQKMHLRAPGGISVLF